MMMVAVMRRGLRNGPSISPVIFQEQCWGEGIRIIII